MAMEAVEFDFIADEKEHELNTVLSVIVIGKTGDGKSATLNFIANKFGKNRIFPSMPGRKSVTQKSNSRYVQIKDENGQQRLLLLTDTPGTMDTCLRKLSLDNLDMDNIFQTTDKQTQQYFEKLRNEFIRAVAICHEGCSAFLLVFKFGARLNREEEISIKILEQNFGERMYQYTIIIFTHGEAFERWKNEYREEKKLDSHQELTYLDYANSEVSEDDDILNTLIQQVEERIVVFQNYAEGDRSKVFELFKVIDKMQENLQKRGLPSKYSNEQFEIANQLYMRQKGELVEKQKRELELIKEKQLKELKEQHAREIGMVKMLYKEFKEIDEELIIKKQKEKFEKRKNDQLEALKKKHAKEMQDLRIVNKLFVEKSQKI